MSFKCILNRNAKKRFCVKPPFHMEGHILWPCNKITGAGKAMGLREDSVVKDLVKKCTIILLKGTTRPKSKLNIKLSTPHI